MYKRIWTILSALPLIGASCSDMPQHAAPSDKQTVRVTVGSGPRIDIAPQSRTELDEDGVTIRWSDDDRIALWAVNGNGAEAFNAATFALWHYNASFGSAKFRGDIPAMEEGAYTYYAVSPVPDAVSGTLAGYDIPAVQNGAFDGDCDVMVAAPVQGPALMQGDNSDAVRFAFRHKIHVLKIRIPSNALGEKISALELAFPQPVTGRLTIDAAKPDAEGVLTQGSNLLTLRFPEPVEQGATVYATIAPVEIPQHEQITITAIGQSCESKPGSFAGKVFAAGHTTPIALHVPEAGRRHTRLRLTLSGTGEQTLGEKISSFTLSSDELRFDNGAHTRIFTVNEQGDYTMIFREFPEESQHKTISVTYESENAVVGNTFTMPQLTEGTTNDVATLTVPMLLEEDFSDVAGFGNHDNAITGGTNIDTYVNAIALDEYNLPGWTATRCGAEQGNAFRICVRTENAWIANPRYHGRVDTAPITGIKSGKSVKVRVSFDYSIDITWNKHTPKLAYGFHTTQGPINSTSGASTALESPVADGVSGSGGSYSNISEHAAYTIDACTEAHRLSWDIYSTGTGISTIGNSNGYCYLDNIRVSIVNQ